MSGPPALPPWSKVHERRKALERRWPSIFSIPLVRRASDLVLREARPGLRVLEAGAGDRRMKARLEAAAPGLLYRSAFLLYDTATKSLWHHALGRALTGKMRGKRLDPIPSRFVTWDVWRKAQPASRVLAKDPLNVDYTTDAFSHRNRALKLKFGLGILAGTEERLYELSELDRMPLVQETVGGTPVVVVYQPGTQTATAWERTMDGKVLDLRRAADGENGLPRLEETGEKGSLFDAVTGACLSGPLQGRSLKPLVSCWWEVFAWTAHHPHGTMFRASAPPPADLPDVPK